MNKQLTEDVKNLALSMGMDLVGIAPTYRFSRAPEQLRPEAYIKDAKSVVVLVAHIPAGVGEVAGYRLVELPGEAGLSPDTVYLNLPFGEDLYISSKDGKMVKSPKSYGPYAWFGYGLLNYELNFAGARIARFLENRGYIALPIPATGMPHRYFRMGDFSHRHAAVAAGLGELGLNRLLMTPQYGSYQRIISIITTAPLEEDPMYNGPKLCDPEKCGYRCVKMCPVGALEGEVSVIIGDREFKYSGLNEIRCRWAVRGLYRGTGSVSHFEPPLMRMPTRQELAETRQKMHPRDQQLYIFGNINICGRCLISCPPPKYRDW